MPGTQGGEGSKASPLWIDPQGWSTRVTPSSLWPGSKWLRTHCVPNLLLCTMHSGLNFSLQLVNPKAKCGHHSLPMLSINIENIFVGWLWKSVVPGLSSKRQNYVGTWDESVLFCEPVTFYLLKFVSSVFHAQCTSIICVFDSVLYMFSISVTILCSICLMNNWYWIPKLRDGRCCRCRPIWAIFSSSHGTGGQSGSLFLPPSYTPHICHNHHNRWLCKSFAPSVKFSTTCIS